jgi:hypothetical protein
VRSKPSEISERPPRFRRKIDLFEYRIARYRFFSNARSESMREVKWLSMFADSSCEYRIPLEIV